MHLSMGFSQQRQVSIKPNIFFFTYPSNIKQMVMILNSSPHQGNIKIFLASSSFLHPVYMAFNSKKKTLLLCFLAPPESIVGGTLHGFPVRGLDKRRGAGYIQ